MGNINLSVNDAALNDVMRQLDKVENLDKRIKTALTKGAEVLLPVVQRNAPVRTGQLKRALKIGRRSKRSAYYSVEVGAFHGDAPHAHLVEHGHGGPHPAPAHPFLEPALEETEDQIYDAIIKELMSDL